MKYLPGTTVEVNENANAQVFLDSAFATGGLVLSQVVQLTGLEPHTIQNWVKRKFIGPPAQKKYDCHTFCQIALINLFKDIFQIERIVNMLAYARSAGGAVNDVLIYTAFSDAIAAIPADAILARADVDGTISEILHGRQVTGAAGSRLKVVLKIMILSSISVRIRARAELLLTETERGEVPASST